MRRNNIEAKTYYHVSNRGVNNSKIFRDTEDYVRFLCILLHMQSPYIFSNIARHMNKFKKRGNFGFSSRDIKNIIAERWVEPVAFIILERTFHILLYNKTEDGISNYMQRIQNSYGKYFNMKYGEKGSVFEGPYHLVPIEDTEHLLQDSAYIHTLPRSHGSDIEEYLWSSFLDHAEDNRWHPLLSPKHVLKHFKNGGEYYKFVDTSHAREYLEKNDRLPKYE